MTPLGMEVSKSLNSNIYLARDTNMTYEWAKTVPVKLKMVLFDIINLSACYW